MQVLYLDFTSPVLKLSSLNIHKCFHRFHGSKKNETSYKYLNQNLVTKTTEYIYAKIGDNCT